MGGKDKAREARRGSLRVPLWTGPAVHGWASQPRHAGFWVRRGTAAWFATLLVVALFARPAAAHSINVFAIAEGKTLQGEVYARGGEPIRQAKVSVFSPAGEKLGETATDDEGKFTFEARFRTDHRLVVDTGDGHEAEYTLPAEELPESLPAPEGEPVVPPAASSPPEHPVEPSPATAESSGGESMHEELAALQAQVAQFRRELAAYQQKLRLTDIAGAIGYILGLMGLSFYFLGVRKRDEGQGMRGEAQGMPGERRETRDAG